MDDTEKQQVIATAMGTRRGRKNLGHEMVKPIAGGGVPHPCKGCGHNGSPGECDGIVHVAVIEGVDNSNCWHPEGVLAIGDERRGGRVGLFVDKTRGGISITGGFGFSFGADGITVDAPVTVFDGMLHVKDERVGAR